MSGTVLFCTDTLLGRARATESSPLDPTVEVVRARWATSSVDRVRSRTDHGRLLLARRVARPDARPFLGVCGRAPRLDWLHTSFAGTDHPVFDALRDRGITITNGVARVRSVDRQHGDALPARAQPRPAALDPRPGRAALGAAAVRRPGGDASSGSSAWVRSAVRWRDWRPRSRWRSSACGAVPAGTSRAARGRPIALPELLAWADAVVVTAPLTDATRGMFDAGAFAAMRPRRLVRQRRAGRGRRRAGVDRALARGHVGGAGLDVFATEPLPHDSPLWSMPNVIITPHSSGVTDAFASPVDRLVRRQLRPPRCAASRCATSRRADLSGRAQPDGDAGDARHPRRGCRPTLGTPAPHRCRPVPTHSMRSAPDIGDEMP